MKISIIGLGWFGSALALELQDQYELRGTSRNPETLKNFPFAEPLQFPDLPSEDLMDADAIVLNIPPFKNQLDWFKSWNWKKKTHLIFISSISVYGPLNGVVDEDTTPQPDSENAQLLLAEENWASTFKHATIIRFGGLIGGNRHPGKILSGRKNLQGGNWPVNLLHQDDACSFTRLVIEKKITHETFNLVHPDHPTRRHYYQTWCKNQGLSLPEFEDSDTPGKIISHQKASSLYQFRRNSAT